MLCAIVFYVRFIPLMFSLCAGASTITFQVKQAAKGAARIGRLKRRCPPREEESAGQTTTPTKAVEMYVTAICMDYPTHTLA